jgi:hypothetical protein
MNLTAVRENGKYINISLQGTSIHHLDAVSGKLSYDVPAQKFDNASLTNDRKMNKGLSGSGQNSGQQRGYVVSACMSLNRGGRGIFNAHNESKYQRLTTTKARLQLADEHPSSRRRQNFMSDRGERDDERQSKVKVD